MCWRIVRGPVPEGWKGFVMFIDGFGYKIVIDYNMYIHSIISTLSALWDRYTQNL